jgi:hypothetical protein
MEELNPRVTLTYFNRQNCPNHKRHTGRFDHPANMRSIIHSDTLANIFELYFLIETLNITLELASGF